MTIEITFKFKRLYATPTCCVICTVTVFAIFDPTVDLTFTLAVFYTQLW